MCSSPQYSRKYSLSILTGIVLCSAAVSAGCSSYFKKQSDRPNTAEDMQVAVNKYHAHPSTAKGTGVAVKEIVAVVEKSLADLPAPSSVPTVCADEMKKLKEVSKTAPGRGDAASANSALLRCMSKATNETVCKGKPHPCGVVFYTPPIRLPDPRQPVSEPSEAEAVDVSMPDQIAAACGEIAKAGGLSTSASTDAATGAILGSMVGNYSCGAWFKAAAKDDPTLLIGLGFVPTTQLIRDLKTYTNGVLDVTPEAVLSNSIKRVDFTLVTSRLGGAIVPVGVLPIVPVGGTPGEVLDGAHETVKQRINQVGKAVEDRCKAAGICH